jgi:hypothetical protein
MPPSFICPHCGAEISAKASACPECGSDEETGWSEDAHGSGVALPDNHFNYDKFVEKEFGKSKPPPTGVSWFWWFVGVLLLATLLWITLK